MAESINTQISDDLIDRQIRAGRIETGLRRQVWDQLRILEDEILSALKLSDPTELALLTAKRREIQRLMDEEIDPLIQARYARLATLMDDAMMRLATQEAKAVQGVVNAATDDETITELPSERRLRAGVVQGLFPSASKPTDQTTFAKDWWGRQGQGLSQRVNDSLMMGVSQEESLTELARRIRGTSENGFQDGIMAKARQDTARLLTTQVANAVSEARVAVADRNPDVVLIEHNSILDSKTSSICLGRHGLRYTVPDHDPVGHSVSYLNGAPYHPNCRSSFITVVTGGGAVPQQTVTQWLRNRDTAYQDAVLGPKRAQMWRAGRLTVRELIDSLTGRPLTLEEIGA